MKIKYSQFKDYLSILSKLEFDVENNFLFFPIEMDIQKTSEYGLVMEKDKLKTRDNMIGTYSNMLISGIVVFPHYTRTMDSHGSPCIIVDSMIVSLGYATKGALYDFDISEYTTIIPQSKLSNDELSKVNSLECSLVDQKDAKISRIDLFGSDTDMHKTEAENTKLVNEVASDLEK